jgi:hypothetical protein
MREEVEVDDLIHEDAIMSCVGLLPLYEGNFIICAYTIRFGTRIKRID